MTARADLENTWRSIEQDLGIDPSSAKILEDRPSGVRAYVFDKSVWKIRLKSDFYKNKKTYQSLAHENRIIQKISHIKGTVSVRSFVRTQSFDALLLERAKGKGLDHVKYNVWKLIRINVCLIVYLLRVSMRGTIHGDVITRNIFFDDAAGLTIIDFGHAREAGVLESLFRNFFYKSIRPESFNKPYLVVLVRTVELWMPKPLQPLYRRLLGLNESHKGKI